MRNRSMKNHFATSIHHKGYLYGFDNAILKCIAGGHRAGAMAQTRLSKGVTHLCRRPPDRSGEQGQLALVEAIPEAYIERPALRFCLPVLDCTHAG